ncbi:MAG: hypothetical protein HY554_16465 [Elusimicrobia bacterium]|nr:hypothetical protein [Elusimicrobiota bacterium]
MIRLALSALLAACPVRAEEAELSADPEMRREMEKAETSNLENAAAAAAAESDQTLRLLRALMAASEAGVEAARVELEALLRDPGELRRRLGSAGADAVESRHEALLLSTQMLAAKGREFLVAASSVPFSVPDEEPARLLALRASYNAKNRSSDLRRAQADAARAQKRLGVGEPWPAALEALKRLDGYVAEVKDALAQAKASAGELAPPSEEGADPFSGAREALLARAQALEQDFGDLQRESDLLRSNLVLQKADRQITGRSDPARGSRAGTER